MSTSISATEIGLPDNAKLKLGTGEDLEIYHNGTSSFIDTATGHDLYIRNTQGNRIRLEPRSGEDGIQVIADGAVEIYHNGGKKFASHTNGLTIKNEAGGSSTSLFLFGSEGESAEIQMNADDGDDNADYFRLIHVASDNTWRLQNYAAGSWQNSFLAISNGATELYNQGTKHFETMSNGVKIDSGGDTILEMHTSNSTAHSRIQFSNNTGDNYGGLWYSASNQMEFRTNNAERMRITSGGSLCVGVDTTANSEKLRVDSTGSTGTVFLRHGSTDNVGMMEIRHVGADGGNNRVMIKFGNADGNAVGNIISNGSSTSYNTSSDYRLKENVTAISDGITRLKTLKPSRFNFKVDKDTTVDGFLAHEVTAVPEAISGTKDEVDSDNNPVYQGIDQSKLVPLIVATVQELAAKVEALEAA